jgi:cytochrome c oxidase subunit 4
MKRVSKRATMRTGGALLLLWGASWGLSYLDLGAWSFVIAFGIAAAKAVLVVLFFMEIAVEETSVHATLVTGLAMIAVLIAFMVADVKTRDEPLLASPAVSAAPR